MRGPKPPIERSCSDKAYGHQSACHSVSSSRVVLPQMEKNELVRANARFSMRQDEQAKPAGQPIAAFVLSLLAGLWMLAAGAMMGGFGMGGMMARWPGMGGWMWGPGNVRSFPLWSPWFGVAAGVIVLIGAVMLYVRSEQRRSWGVVVLVASALDIFLGMMGLLAGTLGVIGGVLALSGKD